MLVTFLPETESWFASVGEDSAMRKVVSCSVESPVSAEIVDRSKLLCTMGFAQFKALFDALCYNLLVNGLFFLF